MSSRFSIDGIINRLTAPVRAIERMNPFKSVTTDDPDYSDPNSPHSKFNRFLINEGLVIYQPHEGRPPYRIICNAVTIYWLKRYFYEDTPAAAFFSQYCDYKGDEIKIRYLQNNAETLAEKHAPRPDGKLVEELEVILGRPATIPR